MTNLDKPAARDLIRAYLRNASRAPTRAELVAVLDGSVKENTIDNFIHDGRKTGEVQIVLGEDGRRRIVLACGDFVPPKKRVCDAETVRVVQASILEVMRRDCRPVSIDVLIASMPEGTNAIVVRALVRSMTKAKMVLLSLADGSPCYQLANNYRTAVAAPGGSSDPRVMQITTAQPPIARFERSETTAKQPVSPPAPKSAPPQPKAPTGPAPVAPESPASSPPPCAESPSTAPAAAPETITDADLDDIVASAPGLVDAMFGSESEASIEPATDRRAEWERMRDAIVMFKPPPQSLAVEAEGFARGMREMVFSALSLDMPDKLKRDIVCSALQAQRNAILLRVQEALWNHFNTSAEAP